jgi:diguanylate cyclase (GGDEF)-like protein
VRQLIDRGELDAALQLAQATLPALADEAQGDMLLLISMAQALAGRFLDALRSASRASRVFEACGSRAGLCDVQIRISHALRAAGDQASAIKALETAEELARELGDPLRMAAVLRQLGVCCSLIGRHRQALSCLDEALSLLRRHGSLADLLNARLSLYNAHNREADTHPAGSEAARAAAQPYLERWQTYADDCAAAGQTRLELMGRGNHAVTLYQYGDAQAAAHELQGLLELYRAHGMLPNLALCHSELGRCHEALGDPALAREQYRLAATMLRGEGSLDDLQQTLEGLSRVEEALGDLPSALAALREVREVDRRKTDAAARDAVVKRDLRIELARQASVWAQQATQDPLTGLGNRRALEAWLNEHLPRVEQGRQLTLLLMDLDYFKQVNDRHGHDVGDEVLRRVAELIRRHCRHLDLAVRFGGEEFLLAMADLSLAEGAEVGERVRAAVAEQPWGSVRAGLAVTVSIGVTEAREAADAQGLLTLADQRLYTAKLGGRNQVVSLT